MFPTHGNGKQIHGQKFVCRDVLSVQMTIYDFTVKRKTSKRIIPKNETLISTTKQETKKKYQYHKL